MKITEAMRVLQFGDSMLPVGAFSFSNGLESAIQLGLVSDAKSLHEFVLTVTQQAAGVDGIAMLEAYRAARAHDMEGVLRVDAALWQRKLNEEMRMMTARMGKKLAEMGIRLFHSPSLTQWLASINGGATPGAYPVGQGLLFADLDLSEGDAFAVHQYGVASMVLGAALRLLRVDHLETQRILFDVNTRVASDYARICNARLEDMAAFTPELDILAAMHVKAHIRMFMN
ncbi:MAG: urease accessory UreF family protein [Caldilinea sp.]|uniref:urease accessory protein UreF n=1 Tax=Caldilinea sp. TaxID=2293560 RepID=UPI002B7C9257|nr:urease accessory UreF family protein [Caldilinea sp.]HRA66419.1 urease accessory UreF family protein [Caldilinea sp.]